MAQTSILAWRLVRSYGEINYFCIQHLLGTRQVYLRILCVLELLTSLAGLIGGHPLWPQSALHVRLCAALHENSAHFTI
jgi:hypothetical protein